MRKFNFLILLISCETLFGDALEEKAQRNYNLGHFKEAIQNYQELANRSSGSKTDSKKGEALVALSKAYLEDQELGKSFQTFLDALNSTPAPSSPALMTADEKILYEEALKIYLDPSERDPQAISAKLRDFYAGIWRLHPDYYHLGYLVAVAYANLNEFNDFFDAFYHSYTKIPDHFLAFKSQGILHIKLYERARLPEEKEKERELILNSFEAAKNLNPNDSSLYRLQIVFSPEKAKVDILQKNLNEILSHNIIVPRADLPFYFDQLFAHGQLDLATEFLSKARKWYPYSRILDASDAMVKEKTSQNLPKGEHGTKSAR